ncbi:MAG: GNAT family N-acetyltransferase [Candidatus Cloacimonetes bacterium]|nr:GNAT family N-acetyltransferase [Candidatus Cloacimonadota bacterium]
MKINLTVYTPDSKPAIEEKYNVVQFLYHHLEQYRDSEEDIQKSVDYALANDKFTGGIVIVAKLQNEIVGAVIINCTGMNGYVPDNLLVYIAVHNKHRGKKIGRFLMNKTIDLTDGDIALHVEADNPAKLLYEKVGFTNKYLEMRYIKPI